MKPELEYSTDSGSPRSVVGDIAFSAGRLLADLASAAQKELVTSVADTASALKAQFADIQQQASRDHHARVEQLHGQLNTLSDAHDKCIVKLDESVLSAATNKECVYLLREFIAKVAGLPPEESSAALTTFLDGAGDNQIATDPQVLKDLIAQSLPKRCPKLTQGFALTLREAIEDKSPNPPGAK